MHDVVDETIFTIEVSLVAITHTSKVSFLF